MNPNETPQPTNDDAAVKDKMKQFMKENYSKALGDDIELLDEEGGISKLATKLEKEMEKKVN